MTVNEKHAPETTHGKSANEIRGLEELRYSGFNTLLCMRDCNKWKLFLSFFFFSELDSERRALEESEREKRLLASRVEDLSGRLELSERERREVCQVIND